MRGVHVSWHRRRILLDQLARCKRLPFGLGPTLTIARLGCWLTAALFGYARLRPHTRARKHHYSGPCGCDVLMGDGNHKTKLNFGGNGKDVVSEAKFANFFMTTADQDQAIQAVTGRDYDRSTAKATAPTATCDGVVFKASARVFENQVVHHAYSLIYLWSCVHEIPASVIRAAVGEEHALQYAGYLKACQVYGGPPRIIVTDISCLIKESFNTFHERNRSLKEQHSTGRYLSERCRADASALAQYNDPRHAAIGARPTTATAGLPKESEAPVAKIGNWHVAVHGGSCRHINPLQMAAADGGSLSNGDPKIGSDDSGETVERVWILSALGRAKQAAKWANEMLLMHGYHTQAEHKKIKLVRTILSNSERIAGGMSDFFDDAFEAMADFSPAASKMYNAGGYLHYTDGSPEAETTYFAAIQEVQGGGEYSALTRAYAAAHAGAGEEKKEATAAAAMREYIILRKIQKALPALEELLGGAGDAEGPEALTSVVDQTVHPLLLDAHTKVKKELDSIARKARTNLASGGRSGLEKLLFLAADKVRAAMAAISGVALDPNLQYKALGTPDFERGIRVAATVCMRAAGRELLIKAKELILIQKAMQPRSNDGGRSHTMSDTTQRAMKKSKVWKAAHKAHDDYTTIRNALNRGGEAGGGSTAGAEAAGSLEEVPPLATLVADPETLGAIETDGAEQSTEQVERGRLLLAMKKWSKWRSQLAGSRRACQEMINYTHTQAQKGLRQLQLAEAAVMSCVVIDGRPASLDAKPALVELHERLRSRGGGIPDKLSATALRALAAALSREAAASLGRAVESSQHIETLLTRHYTTCSPFDPKDSTHDERGSRGWVRHCHSIAQQGLQELQQRLPRKIVVDLLPEEGGDFDDEDAALNVLIETLADAD